ncbi:MAG: ABC transporter ATP-binding protein [Desertimonas sp.]
MLGELRGSRAIYATAITVALVEVAASLAFPLVQRAFFDDVLVGRRTDLLAAVLALMGGLAVLMIVTQGLSRYLFAVVGERIALRVRGRLVSRLHRQPVRDDETGRLSVGEAVSATITDVGAMAELYSEVIGTFMVNMVRLVGIIIVLAVIDARLLLLAAPVMAIYALVPLLLTGRLQTAGDRVHERHAELTKVLHEGFSARWDVVVFGRVPWAVRRQHRAGARLLAANLQRTRLESLTFLGEVVYWATIVAVCWYGATAVAAGSLTVGSVVALIQYFGRLEAPTAMLVTINNRLQAGLAAARRVYRHADPEAGSEPGATTADDPAPAAPAALDVVAACFRHRADAPCLEDATLHAAPGEIVAVVGPTGSGKSTLFDIVLGCLPTASGRVVVGGEDLSGSQVTRRCRLVSVSSADGVLFDLPVSENIRFGRLGASDSEVRAAADLARVDEFVDALPDGLATPVGENGSRLSTGQRQRVLLARALVRRPAVLLLDEATSGLDQAIEGEIFERLARSPDSPTVVMNTHRPSTVGLADRIYEMHDGRLHERHIDIVAAVGRSQPAVDPGSSTSSAAAASGSRANAVSAARTASASGAPVPSS